MIQPRSELKIENIRGRDNENEQYSPHYEVFRESEDAPFAIPSDNEKHIETL